MIRYTTRFLTIVPLLAAMPALAADVAAGQQKADEACMSCHVPGYLAGKTEQEALSMIEKERTSASSPPSSNTQGGFPHPPVFDELSQDDLANIAAYLVTQKPAESDTQTPQ